MAAKKSNIVSVTTPSGFTCEVDKDKLNSWEFARLAAAASENEGESLRLFVYMTDHVLSREDSARLEDHVRLPDGRVPADAVIAEISGIFQGVKEAKK